jgi:hypothetical protein
MNEPDNAPSDGAVISAYDRLYSAVRSVDTNHIAIIEGTFDQWDWSMLPNPASQGWTDVMYEMHEYQWNDTTNPAGVEAGTNNQVSDFQNHASYGVPDYVGEFNDFGTGSSTWQYTLQQYDDNNISWSFWSYKATDGTAASEDSWGLYDPVNTLPSPNIQSLNTTTTMIAKDWTNITTAGAFAINVMLQSAITGAGVNAGIAVWTGKDSNNWNDPGNWNTSSVPTSSTNVIIDSGDPIASAAINVASLLINGGELQLASGSGSSVIGSLAMTGTGILDMTNNKLLIDFGTGVDPITSITAWIKNGYYGLSGPTILSSAIATNDAATGLSYGLGYADGKDGVVAGLPAGEVEIMFTLLGDANLDGTVNAEDFTPFSQNLGQNGMWDDGDFNYDGTVNAEDFTLFSHNLGESAVLATVSDPAITIASSISSPASSHPPKTRDVRSPSRRH